MDAPQRLPARLYCLQRDHHCRLVSQSNTVVWSLSFWLSIVHILRPRGGGAGAAALLLIVLWISCHVALPGRAGGAMTRHRQTQLRSRTRVVWTV